MNVLTRKEMLEFKRGLVRELKERHDPAYKSVNLKSATFGAGTLKAIKALQSHLRGVEEDGRLSAGVVKMCAPSVTVGKRAVIHGMRYLGVKEAPAGSNRGRYIDGWLEGAGYGHFSGRMKGLAWCACFGWAMLKAADYKGPHPWAAGSTVTWAQWIRKGLKGLDRRRFPFLKCGDILIYHFGSGGPKHFGLFIKWKIPGVSFYALEGNTAFGNDSNGGEVMIRERRVRDIHTAGAPR